MALLRHSHGARSESAAGWRLHVLSTLNASIAKLQGDEANVFNARPALAAEPFFLPRPGRRVMNSESRPAAAGSSVDVVCGDRQRTLQIGPQTSVRHALDTGELRVRAACGGLGTCGACLITVLEGDFNPPTMAERQKLLPEDLAQGRRLACQLYARGPAKLSLEHPAPESVWKSLDSACRLCTAGNPALGDYPFGVAVDLGTTHIRLSLWQRQTGRRIGSRIGINPQLAHGADVLTRLDAERLAPAQSRVLAGEARKAVIEGIRDILSRDLGEIAPILAQIGKVLIVGNTAMLSLICGASGDSLYDPVNWQVPIACIPDDAAAWRDSWRMPHADIEIGQPLAGFVGSDLLAALIAADITAQPAPAILADFGTNTEIALWDGSRIWATSVPGGPAFEGVGIRNGIGAEAGAIHRVEPGAGISRLHTLDAAPARGFCGSGFIDAVALLLAEGLLKPSGRFAAPQPAAGLRLDPDNPRTAIFASDIDIFQRAKASTAAAMAQLAVFAGLDLARLDSFWICGSFGRHLQLSAAIRLGLLPALSPARFRLLADASLAGCEKLLLAAEPGKFKAEITQRIEVVNLGGVVEYENRFIDHLRLQPIGATE